MAYLPYRRSKEEQEFYDMKTAAAEYYCVNRVPEEIERVLSELFFQKPDDIHGYLANHFTTLSAPPRVSRLSAREVYDARGQLSVQTEVFCIVCNKEKHMSSASISSILGQKETLQDGGKIAKERASHVATAVQWTNNPLSDMLKELNPCEQSALDELLSAFFAARYQEAIDASNREKEAKCSISECEVPPSPPSGQSKAKRSAAKSKKTLTAEKPCLAPEPPESVLPGSLAVGCASLALARAGARIQGLPLYQYVAALRTQEAPVQFHVPTALISVLSCGRSSPGKLNLPEEVILIPGPGQRLRQIIATSLKLQKEVMKIMSSSTKAGVGQAVLSDGGAHAASCERPEQPLDMITEACDNLGLTLGGEIHLALNCAAPELMDYTRGKYEISTGLFKSPDELLDIYQTLVTKYPSVVALIDPLRGEDPDQWEKLSGLIGNTCSLISDISFSPKAPPLPGVRGRLLKHVNETTVSDLIRITGEQPGAVIMGSAFNESCGDDALPDIAVALGLDYIKLGGLSGAERMAKYNRLICIEEDLERQGTLVSKEKHPPPLFPGNPQEQSAPAV